MKEKARCPKVFVFVKGMWGKEKKGERDYMTVSFFLFY